MGAAPSLLAAVRGHYYAGQRNRFWRLLHQAGLTPRELAAEEDARVLEYGIGLTAILPYIISTDNSLLPEPTERDRARLRDRLLSLRPGFICYNGMDVWRMCMGDEKRRWGLQPDLLGESRQFIVHSSSGRADRWGADRLFLWRELKRHMDDARAAGE